MTDFLAIEALVNGILYADAYGTSSRRQKPFKMLFSTFLR